ncbi:NADP-binding protein [Dacryopinax primogenitus]|uniref:NADP-binding protein n=1 Tax=Dacryopinax primogenitus (strain DJM 731) TaxID=1858805 RepID=M5GEM4_DACPD|nr:NADP-binding protein [Dacryopinax primogenitus]EJU05537.1 NADP-binding protein [Dacryopinax primogenitus]
MAQRLVVVTGGTGTQGGAVARALVTGGIYRVRAISRHPHSPASKELTEKGVEVVYATLEDRESLIQAFQGAYAVYGCTPFGHSTEEQQGKNIVDACKANHVSLLIWSSLPNAIETSGGRYRNMTHYDRKANVAEYIGKAEQPAITIYTGVFSDNLLNYGWIRQSDSGTWVINTPVGPDAAIPHTWIRGDLGPAVVAMINSWEEPTIREELREQQPIHVCSYRITGTQMAETVAKLTGQPAVFAGARSQERGELGEMFQYQDEGLLYPEGAIPPPLLAKLGVEFHKFEDYVLAEIAAKRD